MPTGKVIAHLPSKPKPTCCCGRGPIIGGRSSSWSPSATTSPGPPTAVSWPPPPRTSRPATAPDEPSGHRPEQEHAARGPTARRRPLDLAVDQLERLRDRGGAWDTQARIVTG